MAGHSKWANIQHRKGAQDAKRGKLFTKLIREVSIAARLRRQRLDRPYLRNGQGKLEACSWDEAFKAIAARLGGGDPAANSRLRLAIDKALSGNVPKDTIERAIKRASGDQNADNIEEVRYEGYGPGGVAVMVDCMTPRIHEVRRQPRHRRLGILPVHQARTDKLSVG